MTAGQMYNWRVAAVHNALSRAGKAEGPLELSDLTALGHLDQYHYLGTEACDHVATLLGLAPGASVLDIGAGIGGPARYLAAQTGCSVVGVELQDDLAQAATELTARVVGDLSERVQFVTGDICSDELALPVQQFDHMISLLVFLHIPHREVLLRRCHDHIKPGGSFVIEDFCSLAPFTSDEAATLSDLVKVRAPGPLSPCRRAPMLRAFAALAGAHRHQPRGLPRGTPRGGLR
jgi:SAM-dependent methyltransferase